ncbi:unannotated protein [freshwater metagenome]|uniref:Unannotated protein n=1 Tax=freshwater metagenome TaxID=449393 RepID=A0A6J7F016_9ZZZZ
MCDGLGVVALVQVDPPECEQHAQPTDVEGTECAPVPGRRGLGEPRQLGHRNVDAAGEQFGHLGPPGAEHDEQVVLGSSRLLGEHGGGTSG